ncbi:MAG: hypothetical protein JXJ22_08895 [Bacteroidales bacterium]|nr:hypothetical protein [Bacteroidales bacterium]
MNNLHKKFKTSAWLIILVFVFFISIKGICAQSSYDFEVKEKYMDIEKLISDIQNTAPLKVIVIYSTDNKENSEENMLQVEYWMCDLSTWSRVSDYTYLDYILQEEKEEELKLESWMFKEFCNQLNNESLPNNIVEEEIPMEDWMLNPGSWDVQN